MRHTRPYGLAAASLAPLALVLLSSSAFAQAERSASPDTSSMDPTMRPMARDADSTCLDWASLAWASWLAVDSAVFAAPSSRMALSLMVVGTIYSFQRVQARAFATESTYSDSQNVTRTTLDLMTRELRMAAYDPSGLALADLLLGRVNSLDQSGLSGIGFYQWYQGVYAQDTWRVTPRVTVNAGLRWEPFFSQNLTRGANSIFSRDLFKKDLHSKVFVNAPAGLLYAGDDGYPPGTSGLNKKWWNLSPRLGVAWDVRGDGRTAVRSSYALVYDFPTGEFFSNLAGAHEIEVATRRRINPNSAAYSESVRCGEMCTSQPGKAVRRLSSQAPMPASPVLISWPPPTRHTTTVQSA